MIKKIPIIIAMTLLITSCSKNDKSNTDLNQSNNEQLLARISELETENNQLKKELDKYETTSEQVPYEKEQSQTEQKNPQQGDKMIGGEEKGAGKVELQNASGNGSHITVIADDNQTLVQIGIYLEEVETDGSEPTKIYVDGKENTTAQVSKESTYTSSLTLEGKDLEKGTHNVEVIQEINGQQIFYRVLTYEVK